MPVLVIDATEYTPPHECSYSLHAHRTAWCQNAFALHMHILWRTFMVGPFRRQQPGQRQCFGHPCSNARYRWCGVKSGCLLCCAGLGEESGECYIISDIKNKGDGMVYCDKEQAYNTKGYEVRACFKLYLSTWLKVCARACCKASGTPQVLMCLVTVITIMTKF